MLSVAYIYYYTMLSVIMPNAVMLSVVAPNGSAFWDVKQ
jgi:hypothetical protein